MSALLAVALGGALGAAGRWLAMGAFDQWFGVDFPWGTLAVNVAGSFAMGALVEAAMHGWSPGPELRAALTAGVLGGFTTFSAFALDIVSLVDRGAVFAAGGYAMASVVFSVVGLIGGIGAARWLLA